MIESFVLIIHIGSFFCIIIPLIMFGPLNDASFVFTKFVNSAGWKSDAVSWSVGLITSTYPFLCKPTCLCYSFLALKLHSIGYDGACHMSEEIKSAPIVVPCSILTSVVLNGILGFVFLIVTLFTMGDIRLVLGSHTSHAMIVIFFNATRSKVGTTVMISIFTMIAIFAATTAMTSTSRLMWAFARDNGLPFSGFLTKLQPRWNIPLHSIALSAALNVVLSLIIVASATAFSAIISLNVVALYVTYMLPILLMLRLRIKYPNSIQYGPFKLGKLGIPLNGISVLYVIYTGVFLLFPGALPVNPSSMNYSCLALGAAIFLVVGMWFVKGRKEYKGPLKEI
jgi:amino acid transporter